MTYTGNKIRLLRLRNKWPQAKLAALAGISIAALSRIEQGYVKPRDSTLDLLALALGVHARDLTGEVKPHANDD